MSTVKATNFSHPSASSPAIVLDAAGGATVAGMGLVLVSPTSIANSGGSASASGGAVSFTGVSSVSLNGVFTSTYAHYLVVSSATCSADSYIQVRLRASGTDHSGSNYHNQQFYASSTNVVGAREASQTAFFLADISSLPTNQQIFISNPQLAAITTAHTSYGSFASATIALPAVRIRYGALDNTSQYDGFSFIPNSGNTTGTIRVYGYKNS